MLHGNVYSNARKCPSACNDYCPGVHTAEEVSKKMFFPKTTSAKKTCWLYWRVPLHPAPLIHKSQVRNYFLDHITRYTQNFYNLFDFLLMSASQWNFVGFLRKQSFSFFRRDVLKGELRKRFRVQFRNCPEHHRFAIGWHGSPAGRMEIGYSVYESDSSEGETFLRTSFRNSSRTKRADLLTTVALQKR